jgi:hypothetical protein
MIHAIRDGIRFRPGQRSLAARHLRRHRGRCLWE